MFISVGVFAKNLSVLNLSIFANSCKESEKAKETLLIKKIETKKDGTPDRWRTEYKDIGTNNRCMTPLIGFKKYLTVTT